jgi:hypothetical protein
MPTTVTLHLPEQDHRAINRIIRPMMGFKDFRYLLPLTAVRERFVSRSERSIFSPAS